MSSFRKKGSSSANGKTQERAATSIIRGWKPSIHGELGIVSFGHRKLDELFGGGHALGTVSLLEADQHSDYAKTLMRYEIADAMSSGHKCIIICSNMIEFESILNSLPYNLNGNEASDSQPISSTSELKIAWQYENVGESSSILDSVPRSSIDSSTPESDPQVPPVSNVFCCSFDLSRRIQPSVLLHNPPLPFFFSEPSPSVDQPSLSIPSSSPSSPVHTATFGRHRVQQTPPPPSACLPLHTRLLSLLSLVQSELTLPSPIPTRIFVPSLESLLSCSDPSSSFMQVLQFLVHLKHSIRGRRASLSLCLHPPSLPLSLPSLGPLLLSLADSTLSLETFAGRGEAVSREFREWSGFLVVRRVEGGGALAPFRPPHSRLGLKRDRRKLHIEPLHLPPEESRALPSATPSLPTLPPMSSTPQTTPNPPPPTSSTTLTPSHSASHTHRSNPSSPANLPQRISYDLSKAVQDQPTDIQSQNPSKPPEVSPKKLLLSEKIAAIRAEREKGTGTSGHSGIRINKFEKKQGDGLEF